MNPAVAIVKDPDAFASSLLVAAKWLLAEDKNPLAFLDWDPETILLELQRDAGEFPGQNFNKLMTAIRLIKENSFYRSTPTFIEICNILYDGRVPAVFDPAEIDEIAWAAVEATMIYPPDEGDDEFHPEILAYINEQLRREGFVSAPDAILLLVPELPDQWSKLSESFTDDPEMFGMVHSHMRDKVDDVNEEVTSRLTLLLEQHARLHATETDAAALGRKIMSALREKQKQTGAVGALI